MTAPTISHLPTKPNKLTIQPSLEVITAKDFNGIGMGVLSGGTPYLNQRGLAAVCGVQNAHIGTISSQWNETDVKPRIAKIKAILSAAGSPPLLSPHVEVPHKG